MNFGATLELNEKDLNAAENSIKKSKVLVVSLVIREETALHSLKLAKKHGLLTIFNFAPANKDLSADFNKLVDILVVNEVEVRLKLNLSFREQFLGILSKKGRSFYRRKGFFS